MKDEVNKNPGKVNENPGRGYWETGSSLRSHGGPLRNCMKFEDEVKGEQGLAALALGKFEELYEIEGGS